jgi:two-component system CheB/CheR fusion protein
MKSTPRILYLEKDQSLATMVKMKLEWQDYRVEITDNEIECLQKIRNRKVDLLIFDYATPTSNAIEMLEKMYLRGIFPLTLIVISQPDFNIIIEAIKLGCVDYVIKDKANVNYFEQLQTRVFQALDPQTIYNLKARTDNLMHQHLTEDINTTLASTYLQTTSDAVFITDEQHRIISINPAFSQICGYTKNQIIGKKASLLNVGLDKKTLSNTLFRALKQDNFWQGELLIRHDKGTVIPVWQSTSASKDDAGRITQTISLFRDISQQKEDVAAITYQANYDDLTRLPNRNLFIDRLSIAIKHAQRNKNRVALMLLDLDKFKWINDNLGHHAGDILLQSTAKKLTASVRDSDTIARLGGDEFTIILPELEKGNEAEIIAQKIFQAFSIPITIDEREVSISGSIGIAVYPDDGTDIEALQKSADKAMYSAKTARPNSYRYYTKVMQQKTEKRLNLISSLRQAIENREFTILYQPIIDINSKTIISAEALLRWENPSSGLIAPDDFIPLAEESGLIRPLGNWVLAEVAKNMRRWLTSGLKPINICLNKSAAQFSKENCATEWLEILKAFQIPPERITIEISENTFINHVESYTKIITILQAQGIKISLDCFGTGYSSLTYLNKHPVDMLKIDRSFIHDCVENTQHAFLIETITTLANKMGITVIATGVENKHQLEQLKQHCQYVQGFFFCKPLPLKKFELFLENW